MIRSIFMAVWGLILACGAAGADILKEPANNWHRALISIDGPAVYSFVNGRGEFLNGKFENVRPFSEGLAAVRVNRRWGYIDDRGKMIIEPQFFDVRDFHENFAAVAKSAKQKVLGWDSVASSWGFIDRDGKLLVPPTHELVYDFSEGLAGYHDGTMSCGYIDTKGQIALRPADTDFVQPFSGGLAFTASYEGGHYRYIDKTGKVALQPADAWVDDSFHDGLTPARDPVTDLYGFIDPKGKWTIAPSFYHVSRFVDGRALAVKEKNGLGGIIDQSGHWIVETSIVNKGIGSGRSFHDGFLFAKTNDGWQGYFDREGKRAITLNKGESGSDFEAGIADIINEDSKRRIRWIDTTGKTIPEHLAPKNQ